jgi:DNA mismatch repair protein MutH
MISPENREHIKNSLLYDPFDERQVVARAKELVNHTIIDILRMSEAQAREHLDLRNKGQIGNIIQEFWFGVAANSSSDPDFAEIGMELKIIPLEQRKRGLTVKERTKICAINYFRLIEEDWNSSHAKRKLEKVLFIYVHFNEKDGLFSKVVNVDVWVLKDIVEQGIIREDWQGVKAKVEQGLAHEISESQSKILAASRTGSGGLDENGKPKDEVPQPRNPAIPALKRAFSLKQSYTKQRWEEVAKKSVFESVIASLPGASAENYELKLIERLHEYEGMKIADFARKFNMPFSSGKNAAATIVKKVIGFKNVNARMKELDQTGTEIRVVPLRAKDKKPLEAISFPAFSLKELEQEKWDEAELVEYVDRIIFIPMLYENDDAPVEEAVFGKAFLWEPSVEEWDIIEQEWRMYQKEILDGKAKPTKVPWGNKTREVTGLTKESGTKIIHIRPHGVDSSDRDEDGRGNSVVKQSFWLNKKFVHSLVLKYCNY